MPYRVKAGQEVLVVSGLHLETKTLTRDIEFLKDRLYASPLQEHRDDGIPRSVHPEFPWGFKAKGLWENGPKVTAVYAKEVHMVDKATPKDTRTAVVAGSSGTPYTLVLTDDDEAVGCSCPGFRFNKQTCKHIREWNSTGMA